MFSDIHVHSSTCDGREVLKHMDEVGMERMGVMAPYMGESDARQKESTDIVASICAADPERLFALAWIEPTLSGAVSAVKYAVEEKKVRGFKMIPMSWYPYEKRIFPVYHIIEQYRKPIVFHSGILWWPVDCSRYCRPTFWEALLDFPKLKFALAHISWPWVDECVATFGKIRAAASRKGGLQMQMYIDVTRGTPPLWRKDALQKCIEYVKPEFMMFGTDARIPSDLSRTVEHYEADKKIILDELGCSEDALAQIMTGTFNEFFEPMK